MMAAAAAAAAAASSLFSLTEYNWLAGWLSGSLAWSLHSATHKQSYVIAVRHLPQSLSSVPLGSLALSCFFVLGSHLSVLIQSTKSLGTKLE